MASREIVGCTRGTDGIPPAQNYVSRFTSDQGAIEDEEAELMTKENGSTIAIFYMGFAMKIEKIGGRIKKTFHDISEVVIENIRGAVSGTVLFEELTARIKWEPSKSRVANDIEDWMINLLPRGSNISVKTIHNKPIVVGWSVRIPNYYDLLIQTSSGGLFNYNTRGVYHSGDVTVGNGLFQSIANLQNGLRCVFGVSGYLGSMLKDYRRNNPFIVIIDYENKRLNIVPIALDEATIGIAKTCCPLSCIVRDGTAYFHVLDNPPSSDKEMYITDRMRQCARDASVFRTDQVVTDTGGGGTASVVPVPTTSGGGSRATTTTTVEPGLTVICEGNTYKNQIVQMFNGICKPKQVVYFGKTVGIPGSDLHSDSFDEASFMASLDTEFIAPFLSEKASGGPAMLFKQGLDSPVPGITYADFKKKFDNQYPVIFVTTKMISEMLSQDDVDRFQGLIVIITESSECHPGISEQDRITRLSKLNLTAVLAFAAPKSTVVACVRDKFYYIRGVRSGKLIEKCDFGKEIPDFIEKFNELLPALIPDGNPIVNINTVPLCVDSMYLSIPEFLGWLKAQDFESIKAKEGDILDAMEQMSGKYNEGKELKEASRKICAILQSMVSEMSTGVDIKALRSRLLTGDKAAMEELRRLKGEQTKRKRIFRLLINAAGRMISTRNAGTKAFSLKQQAKKDTIAGNIHATHEMLGSIDVLSDFIDEHYSEIGALTVVARNIHRYFPAVSKKEFCSKDIIFSLLNAPDIIGYNERRHELDGATACALVELGTSTRDMQEHSLAPSTLSHFSLVIPDGMSPGERSIPALLLLLPDEALNEREPSKKIWAYEADKPCYASPRIMMRGLFANNCSTREHPIDVKSQDLTWFFITFIMKAMQEFSKIRSTPVSTSDFDDKFCQIMRGLMSIFLATAGSGSNPVTFCWQIVSPQMRPNVPKKFNDWVLLSEMCKVLPYTAWDMTMPKKKVFVVMIRAIMKYCTNPATESLREEAIAIKRQKQSGHVARMFVLNEEGSGWYWAYCVCLEHLYDGCDITHSEATLAKALDILQNAEVTKSSNCADQMIVILKGSGDASKFQPMLSYAYLKYVSPLERMKARLYTKTIMIYQEWKKTKEDPGFPEELQKLHTEFIEICAQYKEFFTAKQRDFESAIKRTFDALMKENIKDYKNIVKGEKDFSIAEKWTGLYCRDSHNTPKIITGKKVTDFVEKHNIPGEWTGEEMIQMGFVPCQKHIVFHKKVKKTPVAAITDGGGAAAEAEDVSPEDKVSAVLAAASVRTVSTTTMAIRTALTGEIRPMVDIMMKSEESGLQSIGHEMFGDLIKFATGREDVRDIIIQITRIAIENWKLEAPVIEKMVMDHYSV